MMGAYYKYVAFSSYYQQTISKYFWNYFKQLEFVFENVVPIFYD